ncbi:hypothetical protein [Bosea sp. BK604]|uniref:hypothetical protein n=1 Tax=Bosea sp. BK604 TaxID=2512180 RepID=UPI001043806D|nr:hypothetical protein [Bosea sp. BK604]TCR68213.1 hypothetical protein EV560_10240 [Bosea sp. BK604]
MADDIKQSPSNSESEFQAFSRRVDEGAVGRASEKAGAGGDDRNGELTANLKEFGIDTDRMAEAANERVGDFQQMLIDEVRNRPMQALCWAAAAGVVVGLLAAR